MILDSYQNGKRKVEKLELFIVNKPTTKVEREANKTTWQMAEAIRATRLLEHQNKRYGFTDTHRGQGSFLDYFKKETNKRRASSGSYGNWQSTYQVLLKFTDGKDLTFAEADTDFLEKFKKYLLEARLTKSNTRLARNSALSYHMGGLEFTKVVLAKQNQFIKIQFPDTVTHYFNNVEDSQWQAELMLNERDTMSDAEFYKAVQFQFIQYFKWLEEQFYWIYPLYHPYLLGYDDFKNSPNLPEHIQLNYGADNQSVIKDLHEFLHPAYIDDAFEEFAAHFEANSLYTKMQWKRTQKGLAVLFHGIKTGKNYERIFLKMRNKVNSVISQHFINNRGKEITVENADKSKDSIDPGVSSKDSDDILILLKMLNEKYKGENVGDK